MFLNKVSEELAGRAREISAPIIKAFRVPAIEVVEDFEDAFLHLQETIRRLDDNTFSVLVELYPDRTEVSNPKYNLLFDDLAEANPSVDCVVACLRTESHLALNELINEEIISRADDD